MKIIKRHKILCIVLVVILLLFGRFFYDRHFTPQRWADADPYRQRGYMVDSLLMQYDDLAGMTLDEVVDLLGDEYNAGSQVGTTPYFGRIYYAAGRRRALFPQYLSIQFQYGRVEEVRVFSD